MENGCKPRKKHIARADKPYFPGSNRKEPFLPGKSRFYQETFSGPSRLLFIFRYRIYLLVFIYVLCYNKGIVDNISVIYHSGGYHMTEEAKEARRAYQREWRKKNPEKVKAHQARHWEKIAALKKQEEKDNGENH